MEPCDCCATAARRFCASRRTHRGVAAPLLKTPTATPSNLSIAVNFGCSLPARTASCCCRSNPRNHQSLLVGAKQPEKQPWERHTHLEASRFIVIKENNCTGAPRTV